MKEMIEAIMYEADDVDLTSGEFGGEDFLADMDPERVEIFAKLIIQECIAAMSNTGDSEWDGYNNASAAMIKQHFGIK